METKEALAALAALSQENRLGIFRLLVESGHEGLAAGAIAEELGLAPATLSFHVKELTRAGLAHARQEGRFIFYSANFNAMNGLVGYLTENCCRRSACAPCAPAVNRDRPRAAPATRRRAS